MPDEPHDWRCKERGKPCPLCNKRAQLGGTYHDRTAVAGRDYLTRVLTATKGSRIEAAQIAGLNRTYLQALIKEHSIEIKSPHRHRGTGNETAEADAEGTEVSTGAEPADAGREAQREAS